MIILLIKITRHVQGNELYEQTRKCWKGNINNVQNVKYVFSVFNQRITEIYSVDKWVDCIRDDENRGIAFEGKIANEDFDKFRKLDISSLYRRGNANPIMYKKLDELEKLLVSNSLECDIVKIYQPLNQILYGPPGTGKTYFTINKALEIIDGKVSSVRSEAKERFEELKNSGQIEFVTFHQSYGYEEFVEGIKAKTSDKGIEYKIEDGIFKKLCEKAQNKKIFYIGQEIGKYQIVGLTNELMRLKRENGSLIPIPMYLLNEVLDLVNKKIISIADLNNKVAIEKMSSETEKFIINGYPNIFRDLAQYYIDNKYLVDNRTQNYILIIDEINRGNISKIFGELITLIEPSKRIGADEEIRVKLPYSGDDFGVPSNLYIIGTMNTADRSIALMDTALRRRFEFVEMMPKAQLLDFEVAGVSVKSLLETINKRVEYLYDRDHTIGHAYFIDVKTKEELDSAMRNKIIPLLQEYFYDDWEKIRMVLGDGFIKRTKTSSNIFNDEFKQTDYIEDEKFVYEIVQEFDYSSF